jgi:hypothetical protein
MFKPLNLLDFKGYAGCGFEVGKKAVNKTIPYKLLNCSKENASFILRGLFEG